LSDEAAPAPRTFGAVASDYLQISKPRILVLLLMVAWAAMFVAAGGWPDWRAFLAVTLAGAASVAASGAFNNVLERSRDARMARTAGRAVAAGRITPTAAALYGTAMVALSVAPLFYLGLTLAAALTVGAIAYYVLVYTVLLKPTTPQNIVIGGLAGSFPALIGWSAETGSLAWPDSAPAVVLALLVFLWTPAHFWALALLYKHEYGAADFPMMPNVKGEAHTRRLIGVYAGLTIACSLALWPLPWLGYEASAGWFYLAAATGLGALFALRSVGLLRRPTDRAYRTYFFFTIQYLGLLLFALMVDRVALAA
jgi:protoheme IX farnesyltransferase